VVVNEVTDDLSRAWCFQIPPLTLWRLDRYIDPSRELFNAPVLRCGRACPVGHFRRTKIKGTLASSGCGDAELAPDHIDSAREHVRFDPNARGRHLPILPANEINSISVRFPLRLSGFFERPPVDRYRPIGGSGGCR